MVGNRSVDSAATQFVNANRSRRLMCVLAHPDDETLGMGGVLAKYAAEGATTAVLTATRGEYGWSGDPATNPGPAALGAIRDGELRAAAKVLGVSDVTFLDYQDGELDQADAAEVTAKIAAAIRRFRPDVVVTFGHDGLYGHPDHIVICQFATAAIVAASLGILYLPVALAAVVITYMLLKIVSLSEVYDSIEWPVIILLGSMIPIGAALEASGGTALVAQSIVGWTEGLPTIAVLAILMVVTMTLSDVLNNVATALIAAPVAIDIAARLGANPDSFLMAVAVAASCAFLTPIGHKNNMIIMGPGGYRFGDYWRIGLPLEILVIVVSLPMIVTVWPL